MPPVPAFQRVLGALGTEDEKSPAAVRLRCARTGDVRQGEGSPGSRGRRRHVQDVRQAFRDPVPSRAGVPGRAGRAPQGRLRRVSAVRIGLANVCYPATPDESVAIALRAIADASAERVDVAAAAGRANVAVVLGTERIIDRGLLASVLVINRDGT